MAPRRSFPARVSDWLHGISITPVAVVALAIFLIFGFTVLPYQSRQAEEASGGAASPDTSLFYSPAALYRMAEAFGPEGRQAYITARWRFDFVFPLVYGFFLATALSWTFGRGAAGDTIWQRANLVPVIGVVFDYLENIATTIVMARYPAHTPVVDTLAPVFTALKWLFVGGSMLLLPLGLVFYFAARSRRAKA